MFTRILNFDVATHTDKGGTAFFLLCLQGKEKKMIDEKKKEVLDDVETISIYKKEESSAVMILNHFVSFHITPDLLIYIKVTQPQPEDFFCSLSCKPVSCSPVTTYLPYLPHHPPPSSQRISHRVSEKDPACEQRSVLCVVQAW